MGDVQQHGSAKAADFLRALKRIVHFDAVRSGKFDLQILRDYRAAVRTPRYTEQPMQ